MDKYQTQWRIDNGLAPPVVPQWFIDMNAVELLSDEQLAKWLSDCGPHWASIAETQMRCLGRIDPSLKKAIRRRLLDPKNEP